MKNHGGRSSSRGVAPRCPATGADYCESGQGGSVHAVALCHTRAGEIIQEWEAGTRGLALLRGPGLLDAEDRRPFHTVHGPTAGRRFSITFRMDQERR